MPCRRLRGAGLPGQRPGSGPGRQGRPGGGPACGHRCAGQPGAFIIQTADISRPLLHCFTGEFSLQAMQPTVGARCFTCTGAALRYACEHTLDLGCSNAFACRPDTKHSLTACRQHRLPRARRWRALAPQRAAARSRQPMRQAGSRTARAACSSSAGCRWGSARCRCVRSQSTAQC